MIVAHYCVFLHNRFTSNVNIPDCLEKLPLAYPDAKNKEVT